MKKEMRTRYHGNQHEISRNRTCSGEFAEQPIKKICAVTQLGWGVLWVFSDVDLFEKKQFCKNGNKVLFYTYKISPTNLKVVKFAICD